MRVSLSLFLCFFAIFFSHAYAFTVNHHHHEGFLGPAALVKKDQRRSLLSTEYGQISAVKISDGKGGSYHLQFITLEPNALFLPVQLHADMVFYVHSGSGRLNYTDEDELQSVDLQRGDVYRLHPGTFFFIQSNLETERQKLRIYAIFANSNSKEDLQEEPLIGAYSSIRDMLLGFDKRVLQAAFNVPEDVIAELKGGTRQPLIVHGVAEAKETLREVDSQFMKTLLRSKNYGMFDVNKKKDKRRLYNILTAKHDVENCNGWSSTVTRKQLKVLRHSNIGIFMVNLTRGAMMGPHWNPMTTEIAVVLQGRGMVRVVCSSTANETECKNRRFRVEEGDVFAVPRFHPMTQISFNNDSLVFMGFTTTSKNNHPQFLVGKASVFQTLDKSVLAASFNVSNATIIDRLLTPQKGSIMLECTSCAEEEERLMEEEIEREREEARKREEQEAKKREEEQRREEEEARKREEEEARKREGEKRKREEEETRREEEEARKREEEAEKRKREEEETRREEEKRREEEEARKREEEARKREEEKRREEKAAAAAKKEAEEARKREEEKRKREEEAARKEQEEARKSEEEIRRREEEDEEKEARRREEEEATRKEKGREEKAKRSEEEEARREEEKRQQEARKEAREKQEEEQEKGRETEGEEEWGRGEEEEEVRRALRKM